MKRREFITLIGSSTAYAALQPRLAESQQIRPKPRIGMLWHAGSASITEAYCRTMTASATTGPKVPVLLAPNRERVSRSCRSQRSARYQQPLRSEVAERREVKSNLVRARYQSLS
jgi:hypothetical protein